MLVQPSKIFVWEGYNYTSLMSFSNRTSQNVPIDFYLDGVFGKKRNGFFIELGANDGLTQSNTAFFEFRLRMFSQQWKGILSEPSMKGHLQCQKNRPSDICVHCACVSHDFAVDTVLGDFSDKRPDGLGRLPTTRVRCVVAHARAGSHPRHDFGRSRGCLSGDRPAVDRRRGL